MTPDGRSRMDVDVAIVGGGPAGSATAMALAQLGIANVLVVEAGRYDALRIGESLPPGAIVPLQQLGVWNTFLDEGHETSLGGCAAWGADQLGYNPSLFSAIGAGWHLDRRRFDAMLARTVAGRGIAVRSGTRLEACRRDDGDGFRLLLSGNGEASEVTARFVVDASGARAILARHLGAARLIVDQLLCVAHFFERPGTGGFSKLTMVEAVEYGWWYAAKLPEGRVVVVLASDPDIIKRERLLEQDAWLARLARTAHIWQHVAGCGFVEENRIVCAAPSFILDATGGPGWLAVGDAAAAYDPISSQGICKALADGIEAASAIAAYLDGNAAQLGERRAALALRFDAYLKSRDFFYGLERRWPNASFWKKRRAQSVLPARPAAPLPSGTGIGSARAAVHGHPA